VTVQMLFYENAVPVSSRRHAGCAVEVRDYGFCRKVNSVPLTATEFRSAAGEYAIVLAGSAETLQPVVVLGLRNEENLFVSDRGEWLGRYVPAFVRRYPFVFSTRAQDKRFVLCVDEAFAGFNREGRGEPLFAGNLEPSPYMGKVLRFLQEYRAQFMRTRAFCQRLAALDLLEPVQARLTMGGTHLSLGGFSVVNRDKLKALSGDRLGELARTEELELVYLHLQSLRNFEALRGRLSPLPDAPENLAMEPAAAGSGQPVTIH
jgi:hypothetical protein